MAQPRTPSHAEFRPALRLHGTFDVGTACPASVAVTQSLAIGGATKVRIRLLVTGNGGTLATAFSFHNNAGAITPYGTGTTSTAITAGTESLVELYPGGESWMELTFTPSGGTATIVFCDVSQS